ncbi:MAG: hypothetical protein AMXMBFR64_36320 [Myxococcales bacterium]
MSAALLLVIAATGCGPGIAGQWKGTGEIDRDHRFELDLELAGKAAGHAIYTAAAGVEPRRLDLCTSQLKDDTISFQLDLAGRAVSCSASAQRYTFQGVLGEHVLTGQVLSTAGEPIGRWRAFRVEGR